MSKYEITTTNGKYEVTTETPTQTMLSQKVIPQFTKGLYESLPFGKRVVSLLPHAQEIQRTMEETPQARNLPAQLGRTVGEQAPNIAMATPFLGAASMLPLIGRSALATGATGLGAYSGTKALLQRQPIIPAVMSGAGQGLMYGVGGRLGATTIPKFIPGAERIGSALGAGSIGAITSEDKDKLSNAIFMGGLGALNPSQRFNLIKARASGLAKKDWQGFKKLGEDTFDIPQDTTQTIQKYGWEAVRQAGEMFQMDYSKGYPSQLKAPQIAQTTLQRGILNVRKRLSRMYDTVKYYNQKEATPDKTSALFKAIQDMVNEIKDPTSRIVDTVGREISRLQGFAPMFVGVKGGRQWTREFSPQQLEQIMKQAGIHKNVALESLHNLKQQLQELVPSQIWKNPQNANFEQSTAMKIGNKISDFISSFNPHYKMVSNQWRNMKEVEGEIYDLSTKDLSKDWNKLEPSLKLEILNPINKIENYFRNQKLGQYQVKDILEKYHAYQEWTSNKLVGMVKGMQIRKPYMIAGSMLGGALGKALGLPGMLGGSTLGGLAGFMKGDQMSRPRAHIKYLKEASIPK